MLYNFYFKNVEIVQAVNFFPLTILTILSRGLTKLFHVVLQFYFHRLSHFISYRNRFLNFILFSSSSLRKICLLSVVGFSIHRRKSESREFFVCRKNCACSKEWDTFRNAGRSCNLFFALYSCRNASTTRSTCHPRKCAKWSRDPVAYSSTTRYGRAS